MNIKKLVLLLSVFVIALQVQAQTFNWGVNTGTTGADNACATTVDAQNNVYSIVLFTGTITIDSAGTPKSFVSAGNRDILITKRNCNKVFQWGVHIGGTFSDGGNSNYSDILADSSGSIYVASTFSGAANFIGATGATTVRNSSGQQDGFLLKLNNAGVVQWINLVGGVNNDEGTSLAIDNQQNIYMGGYYTGFATFESTTPPNQTRNSNAGSSDYFIAKYSPAGVVLLLSGGGTNLTDIAIDVAVDSTNSPYVVGTFAGSGNANMNFGANFANNAGGTGAFMAKHSGTNFFSQWGVTMGNNLNEAFNDVVIDNITGRVFVCGNYQGTTVLSSRPGGTAVNLSAIGNMDGLLASYNFNGALIWARSISGSGNEFINAVELDPKGDVYISGDIGNAANFGGSTITPSGGANAFIASYTQANVLLTSSIIAPGNASTGIELYTSPSGQLYLLGQYATQMIVGSDTLNSLGGNDVFLIRAQNADSTFLRASTTALLCTNDSLILTVSNKRIGTFNWYRNDTLISVTNGPSIKAFAAGVYKVTSTNSCATDNTSRTITVIKSPFFVAPRVSNISLCAGDTGRLNSTGAALYAWTPSFGLSDSTLASPIIRATTNTSYIVVRFLDGCFDVDTVAVTVLQNCCLTCSSPYQLNQGVVACYPFNGNAQDESGNGNTPVATNVILAQDRFNVNNAAVQFNGFNSFLEVPNSPSIQSPSGSISFTFWARVSAWNFAGGVQYTPILSKSVTTANAQYRAMVRADGAYAMANGNSWNGVIGSATNINTWYFFTIVAKNDTMFYYRNGTLLGFVRGPVAYTLNNTTPLRIGRNDVNTQVFFNGRLDELRIYNRAVSAAEVLALYNLSNIQGKPTISAGLDKNICRGDSVQLTTTGTTANYLWLPNYKLTSDTARSPRSFPDTSNTYVVEVNLSGCKNYDTVRVNVTVLQPFAGFDRSICIGDTATLIAENIGTTSAWAPNYNIAPTNNDTVRVWPQIDTNYIYTTTNSVCTRRDTVRISVIIPTINAGSDVTVCPKDTATFSVTSNGTVRWSPWTYLSDSIGTNVYSVPDTNITYYLNTNYLGCFAYDTVSVITTVLNVDAGTDKLICLGDSVMLTATGGLTYIWLPSYNISDSSSATPIVKPTVPTYYYVASFNSYCARYDSVFVDVRDAKANAGPDKTICNGDSAVIGVSVTGVKTWSPAFGIDTSQLTPYAKPAATTTYYLTANNGGCFAQDTVTVNVVNFSISAGSDATICNGDSVQLNGSSTANYIWIPSFNISDTSIANPWVKPTATTPYFLISNNGYCFRADTVLIQVRDMTLKASIDTSICIGESVQLNATGAVSYQWSPTTNIDNPTIANPKVNPSSSVQYVVLGFDGVVCQRYDTVNVMVYSYPTVDAGPDLLHCMDEFLTLSANVSGQTRLEWAPATYLSDKFAMQPQVSVKAATRYVLSAWNNQCRTTDTVDVKVNPVVDAKFTATPPAGNAPLEITFTNLSTNAYFFTWDFDDAGAGSNTRNTTHTYLSEGRYFVTLLAEDSLGCFDTATVQVDIIEKESIQMPNSFSPNGDGINDRFAPTYNANKFEKVEMKIYNRWGVEIFSTRVPGGTFWDGKVNGDDAEMGIYSYVGIAKDLKGRTYEIKGSITLVR
jgi:gliding motility-associated-like protein